MQGLKAALRSHHEACAALEAACAARSRPGGRGRGVDLDPWLTGGADVHAQVASGLTQDLLSFSTGSRSVKRGL